MAFDIEKYIPYPNYYFKVVGDNVYLDGCMHSAVKHDRDYAIALAKHFGEHKSQIDIGKIQHGVRGYLSHKLGKGYVYANIPEIDRIVKDCILQELTNEQN